MANLVESDSDTILKHVGGTENNSLCTILNTSSVNKNEPVFINSSVYHDDQMLVDQHSKHKNKTNYLY